MAPRKKAAAAKEAEVKEVKEVAEAVVEASAKKPGRKPAAKKAASKKDEPVVEAAPVEKKAAKKKAAAAEVFIEYGGVQVAVDEIIRNAKLTVGEDKDIKVYVKPDESKAYIVAGEESVAMDVYFCE